MKSTNLSVRVDDDDAAFLAGLTLPDARTPSEKLRYLLQAERDRRERAQDPVEAREMVHELLQPARRSVLRQERQTVLRSELLTRIYDRLPDLAGEAWAGPAEDDDDKEGALRAFERQMMSCTFNFVIEVLEVGLTRRSRCYEPETFDEHARQVREVLDAMKLSERT